MRDVGNVVRVYALRGFESLSLRKNKETNANTFGDYVFFAGGRGIRSPIEIFCEWNETKYPMGVLIL